MTARSLARRTRTSARRVSGSLIAAARTEVDLRRAHRGPSADVAVFHEFVEGPWGGGNQFLRALVGELERRGLSVEVNRISSGTPACLFNSFNFDFRRLRRFARPDVRMVHRVDGPIGLYRGFDDGTDARIAEINADLADATIVQSQYSLDAHRSLGIELRDPVIIGNTVDPAAFHPPASREPLSGRRVRAISTSWSDNENKGGDVLAWLDGHLDRDRFELTFVGRTNQRFEWIRSLDAMPSLQVAEELRGHDVFIAPSRNDPCSNALLEALACGLPAVYRRSGGHPELVGDAGLPFEEPEEATSALDRLLDELEVRRAAIRVAPLFEVADRYLQVLRQ